MNQMEMELEGFKKVFDYSQYSHDNHVNVIPEESFKRLVSDTFEVIADVLRETYGPYGATIMISDQNETTTTKDGYNIFNAMGFSHQYKKMVYLAIKKIIERVNRRVGDGTTTCILLAEKIFNNIMPLLKDAGSKRNISKVLNMIEEELNNNTDMEQDRVDGSVKRLTETGLRNLLMVASNYDEELVDVLVRALEPEYDASKNVVELRNVITDESTTYESSSKTSYEIDYLPGDYRCRVNMESEVALAFNNVQKTKVLIYDHTFGASDWTNFLTGYDNETPVVIVARSFSNSFMNNEFVRYAAKRGMVKQLVYVHFMQMKGDYVQDELKDLGAVLHTQVRDVHNLVVDWDSLEDYEISVFKYNCLCIHNATAPEEHIRDLTIELEQEKSFVRQTILKDRIRALKLEQKDTIVSVKAGTSLELKMISDKIDDCVSIAKSAFDYGIVPNLLYYADERMARLYMNMYNENENCFAADVISKIQLSIESMFDDIWISKYGWEDHDKIVKEDIMLHNKKEFYENNSGDASYNIITDQFVDIESLPTSAQYDVEVLVASLSIVKYLLTSRALIFDAFLMTPQGDQGHFQRIED